MSSSTFPKRHSYAFPYVGNDVVVWFYNENNIIPLSIFAKEKWPVLSLYGIFATRFDPEGIKKLDTGKALASDEAYKSAVQNLRLLVK